MTKAVLAAALLWQISYNPAPTSSSFAGGQVTASTYPSANGTLDLGTSSAGWRTLYLERAMLGGSVTTLVEGNATSLLDLGVPATAGSNFADAVVHWVVYATDGTESQARRGSTYVAAVNKAATETCAVSDIGTTAVAVSAGTLTCTSSCVNGLTSEIQFALNCTSSLTQTTLSATWRVDGAQVNTVTPAGE